MAGAFIFLVFDAPPISARSAPGWVWLFDTDASSGTSKLWLLAAIAAMGLYLMFRHFRRTMRKPLALGGPATRTVARDPLRMQAADQLRDSLATFNRQAFDRSESADDLASLYCAFVAAGRDLQNQNSRFMYDAVGASHIQAVHRMLSEMEADLSREWPELYRSLQRLPEHPTERELTKVQSAIAGDPHYRAVMEYLRLLRSEIREELVHAELRYRRLLAS